MKAVKLLLSLLFIMLSCAFQPVVLAHDGSDYQIRYKPFVIKQSGLSQVQHCQNESCIAALISIVLSVIIAGSVVVVSNVVFCLEKEGECLLKEV
ncbi:MAG: hypothetical protein COB77_06445 [Gammaproteobacteria bacterium]|nr:MAG: hypothetical protein COB77_06445 [Gammaproteobacteria bacterium]